MKRSPVWLMVFGSAVGGFVAVWLPWFLAGPRKNMIDGFNPISLLLLPVVGFVAAVAQPRHSVLAGLSSMAVFPIKTVVEGTIDPTSHNLWPLEFALYAVLTVPALLGAAAGTRAASRLPR